MIVVVVLSLTDFDSLSQQKSTNSIASAIPLEIQTESGFEFDEFVTGRGRGYFQPSLQSLLECHLMRLGLVDVHLGDSKGVNGHHIFQELPSDGARDCFTPHRPLTYSLKLLTSGLKRYICWLLSLN